MVYKGGKGNSSPSCVFVGNLPEKVDERDIRDLFDKYGEIRDIDIKHGKTSNYTSYAFIEFHSVRSAEDAVEHRDGYEYDKYRLRVEFAGEKKPRRYISNHDDRGSRYPPPTRTDYRLIISNLPHGCRWQHLKDHMRRAGPVGYVNIDHGRGYVDFIHKSDMKYALRKLDGTELVTPDDSCRIRIRRDEYHRSRSRDGYHRRSRHRDDRRSRDSIRRSGSDNERRRSGSDNERRRSPSISERNRRSPSPNERRRSASPNERSRSRSHNDRRRSPSPNERTYHRDDSRSKSRGSRSYSERSRTRSVEENNHNHED